MTKKVTYLISLFALLAFCLLVGGTYAYWRIGDTSQVQFDSGHLKGELINEYEAESDLYPGDSLDQVVGVKNTGDLDMVVRLKVDKSWEKEQELSADMLEITYNSNCWLDGNDGYYYYKGILAPGKASEESLFSAVTLNASVGNEYKGQNGTVGVSMECLQASSNALSVWDKTYEDLGVVQPNTEETVTTTVTFTADKKFTFDPAPKEALPHFSQMAPGELRTQVLKLKNDYSENLQFFLTIANVEDQDAKVQEMLKTYAKVRLTTADGKEIYDGAAWSDNGEELALATVNKGAETTVTAMIYLDSSMENEYQGLSSKVEWQFIAQGEDTGKVAGSATTGLPKTGDSYTILIAVGILLLLALIAMGYLYAKDNINKRREKEGRHI